MRIREWFRMNPKERKLHEALQDLDKKMEENIVAHSEVRLFISYSSKDKNYADRICNALQQWGYSYWIDRLEMKGDILSAQMENILYKNIREASCLLILLSKESMKSEWVKKEYKEGIRLQNTGAKIKVLPAIIETCSVPEDLKQYTLLDFRSDFDSAILDIVSNFGIQLERRRKEPYISCRPFYKNHGTTQNLESSNAYNLGLHFFQEGNLKSALEKWDLAARIDPNNTDAIYNAASALYEAAMQQNDMTSKEELLKKVIDRYEIIISKMKSDVDTMVNLACVYRESSKWANPIREMELLRNAVELAPNYGLVWRNLGHSYTKMAGIRRIKDLYEGRDEKAIIDLHQWQIAKKCFMRAFELDQKLDPSGELSDFIKDVDSMLDFALRWKENGK